jgi:hypothetical protein
MGKLVVSLDGVVIKEVQITKDKTTLGRRPYNDIVIDNLAVSGEHAVLQMVGNDVFIEDLNSTNGTYINGKAIKKQMLAHNDTVEIGKYKIKYLVEEGGDYEKTMIMRQGGGVGMGSGVPHTPYNQTSPMPSLPALGQQPAPAAAMALAASIKVLSGAAAGRRSRSPRWSPPWASRACRWHRSPSGPTAMCWPMSKGRCAPASTAWPW